MNFKYKFNEFGDNWFYNDFMFAVKKGKPFPPQTVSWDCSRRCNLNCIHCGATKEKYPKELSTQQIKKVIDQLSEEKVKFFGITGGEPLLRKDLIEILEYAFRKGIKTGISTNGYFIDKNISKKISNAGTYSIQISLDGNQKIHNYIRGNNQSFQKVIDAIKNLKKEKIKIISVATVVTPINLDYLEEIKEILLNLKVKYWRIIPIMPIGKGENEKLKLNKTQLKQVLDFVKSNKNKLKIQIGENLPFLKNYEEKIRNSPLKCPVGFNTCCIGVDGHVRGCPEMPDTEKFREGNILESSFSEIWKKGFKKYRERIILKEDKRCSACKDKDKCFGGCWVMREGKNNCVHDLL